MGTGPNDLLLGITANCKTFWYMSAKEWNIVVLEPLYYLQCGDRQRQGIHMLYFGLELIMHWSIINCTMIQCKTILYACKPACLYRTIMHLITFEYLSRNALLTVGFLSVSPLNRHKLHKNNHRMLRFHGCRRT